MIKIKKPVKELLEKTKARKNAVVMIDNLSQLTDKPPFNLVTKKLLPQTPEGDRLSPLLQFLRHARRLSLPPHKRTVENLRAGYRADMLSFHQGFSVGNVQEMSVPIDADNTRLDARLYQPNTSKTPALPVLLVYFHGGGYVMGDLDTHDDACRLLCQHSGMQVLSVAYRLAPEYPYPTAIEDAKATINWVFANKHNFDGVEQVAIGGDSAGANLATVTAQYLTAQHATHNNPAHNKETQQAKTSSSNKADRLLAQLLIYPPTDASQLRPSHHQYGDGYFLDSIDRNIYYSAYYNADDSIKTQITASPILNQNLAGLPPCIVATAGFDVLCDEGKDYAKHLEQHGIEVTSLHFGRLTHGFVNFVGIHKESKQAVIKIAHTWRKLCEANLSEK